MKGIFFILLACVLWAIDALIRYPLLSELNPVKIVFFEHVFLTLLFIYPLYKRREIIWRAQVSHLFYFLIVGGLGSGMATLAFTEAFSLINPSLVILLQKLQPVVAIFLAHLVLGEPARAKFLGWAALCIVGGLIVSFEDIFWGLKDFDWSSLSFHMQGVKGVLYALLAVIGWGSATVFGKKLDLSGYSEQDIMGGRFIFGLLFILPFMNGQMQFPEVNAEVLGKIGLMVILSGLFALYLYYHGLKLISARSCAVAELFFPFCAVMANWIVLGKVLTLWQLVGGLLLLLGSTVIQLKRY